MIPSSLPALFGGGAPPVGAPPGRAAFGAGGLEPSGPEPQPTLESDFVSALLKALGVSGPLPEALEVDLGGEAFPDAPESRDGTEPEARVAIPSGEERSGLAAPLGSAEAGAVAVGSRMASVESLGRTPGDGIAETSAVDQRPAPTSGTVRGILPMEARDSASTAVASGSDDLPEVKYRPAALPRSAAAVVAPRLVTEEGLGAADDTGPSADASALAPSARSVSPRDSVSFAAAPAAASADVVTPDRSWDRLDPELRSRLETVVHRMDAEFGHDVRLIEGYRSPERQAHLFQQGRARPGPVVTWTLDSEHLAGRAVDVQVDGSFEVSSGYRRLQRVAAEEGLRTLGMRDPGHLELTNAPGVRPISVQNAQEAPLQAQEAPQAVSSQAFDAVARPAQVARIAQAARVAQIATVARPGQGRSTASVSAAPSLDTGATPARPDAPTPLLIPDPEPRQPLSPPRRGITFAGGRAAALSDEARSDERADGRAETSAVPRASREPMPDLAPQARLAALEAMSAGIEGSVARTAQLSSTSSLDTMARVESVLQAREMAATGFPSRVSVRLDGMAGPVDQLRVGLFGSAVEADLDLADADTAAHIRSRVSELHSALERRGLELGSLGVTTSRADLANEAILGSRMDATPDLLRSLLSTAAGETNRDSSPRDRWEQQRTDDDGTGSDRPRRETDKEE